jgi:hypothetical protein
VIAKRVRSTGHEAAARQTCKAGAPRTRAVRQIRPQSPCWAFVVVAVLAVAGISGPVGEAADKAGRDKQPAALVQVAELAENLYDAVKAADWLKATASVQSINRATRALIAERRVRPPDLPRLRSALASLNEAIPSRNRPVALQGANEITLIAANLSSAYNPTVPADVARLDYYGRALEIWSAAGDTRKLADVAREMRRTWDTVRPSVEARGGTSEIATFDKLVARLQAANSPGGYAEIAGPVLEAVDGIEKVFGR